MYGVYKEMYGVPDSWAQGCVIQQREKWPRVEFTSLSEDNILNE